MVKISNIYKFLLMIYHIDIQIPGINSLTEDHFKERLSIPAFLTNIRQFVIVTLLVSFTSGICYLLKDLISYQSVAFVLLFLISIVAIFYRTGPILYGSVLSALIWDYFFIYPKYSFFISSPSDVLMFMMFLVIVILNGVLTSRLVRFQENKIRHNEEHTLVLYQFTKELLTVTNITEISVIAEWYIRKYFNLDSYLIHKNDFSQLDNHIINNSPNKLSEEELNVATWVFRNSKKAGNYTDNFPATELTFYPLNGSEKNTGVIVVRHNKKFTNDEQQFWERFLNLMSEMYKLDELKNVSKETDLLNKSGKLYNDIFISISHELKIPVATIMGFSEILLQQGSDIDEKKLELFSEINTASMRLHKLIENLLIISNLESGQVTPIPEWCDVYDIVNKTIDSLSNQLKPFTFHLEIKKNMPLVLIDSRIIDQVLYNLVLNATQYAREGTPINLGFFIANGILTIEVKDRGIGISKDELPLIFNKFYRGKEAQAGGIGLGLSIVKGYVEALRGSISAENRKNGGAMFTIVIPVQVSDIEKYSKNMD